MGKESKGEHYFVITEDIAKSDLTPAEKLVACSITKRTRDRSKTDFMLLRALWIMEDWNISQEIVTTALKNMVSLGIIEKKRCAGGNLVKWVGWGTPGMEEEDWDAIPSNTVSETVKPGIAPNRETRFPLQTVKPGIACKPSYPVCNPSSVPNSVLKSRTKTEEKTTNERSITENKSTRVDAGRADGSFVVLDSDLDSSEQRTVTLLNPNGYQPKLKPKAATLTKSQADLCCQFLGATGEEAKLPTLVTQDQADKPGFIESCLWAAIDAAAAGKVKGRRVAYLAGILANQWKGGKWELEMDPKDIEELQKIANGRRMLVGDVAMIYENQREEYRVKQEAKYNERERKVMAKYGK